MAKESKFIKKSYEMVKYVTAVKFHMMKFDKPDVIFRSRIFSTGATLCDSWRLSINLNNNIDSKLKDYISVYIENLSSEAFETKVNFYAMDCRKNKILLKAMDYHQFPGRVTKGYDMFLSKESLLRNTLELLTYDTMWIHAEVIVLDYYEIIGGPLEESLSENPEENPRENRIENPIENSNENSSQNLSVNPINNQNEAPKESPCEIESHYCEVITTDGLPVESLSEHPEENPRENPIENSNENPRESSSVDPIENQNEVPKENPCGIKSPRFYFSPKTQVVDDLERLYWSKDDTDVTFVVEGQSFPAHKIILKMRSQLLAAMFSQDSNEKEIKKECVLTDIKPGIFERVLRFIYTDRADNLGNDAAEVLEAADKYELQYLKVICEESLGRSLNRENFVEIVNLANRYFAKNLKSYAMEFFETIAEDVVDSYEFQKLENTNAPLALELFKKFYVLKINSLRLH